MSMVGVITVNEYGIVIFPGEDGGFGVDVGGFLAGRNLPVMVAVWSLKCKSSTSLYPEH